MLKNLSAICLGTLLVSNSNINGVEKIATIRMETTIHTTQSPATQRTITIRLPPKGKNPVFRFKIPTTKQDNQIYFNILSQILNKQIKWVYLKQDPQEISNNPTVEYEEINPRDYNRNNPRAARLWDSNNDGPPDLHYTCNGERMIKYGKKNRTFNPAVSIGPSRKSPRTIRIKTQERKSKS